MNKADRKKLREGLRQLRLAGEQMGNLCFNLAQDNRQPPHLRKTFDDCRKDWDRQLSNLAQLIEEVKL